MQYDSQKSMKDCQRQLFQTLKEEKLYGEAKGLAEENPPQVAFSLTPRMPRSKGGMFYRYEWPIYVYAKGTVEKKESGVSIQARIVYGVHSVKAALLLLFAVFAVLFAYRTVYQPQLPLYWVAAGAAVGFGLISLLSWLTSRYGKKGKGYTQQLEEFVQQLAQETESTTTE